MKKWPTLIILTLGLCLSFGCMGGYGTISPPATAFPSLIRLGMMSQFDNNELGHNTAEYLHYPKGTGIWLNNSLAYCTFEPKGNPMDAHAGHHKLSGDCPTLIMKDGKPIRFFSGSDPRGEGLAKGF